MLSVSACVADYGHGPVLDGVSFAVSPGDVVAILGPSGCGKSTLLALLAGLKAPRAGAVLLDGVPPRPGDGRIGLMPQGYGLFPWMTALANVRLALELRRPALGPTTRAAITGSAARALELVGLSGVSDRYPGELSGGEQQRVAVARTLVREPELLLMDEPFSSLDAITREELQELTLRLLAARRTATVLVTHSIEEAVYMSSTVLLLGRAPASRIVAVDRHAPRAGRYDRTAPAYFEVCRRVRMRLEEVLRG